MNIQAITEYLNNSMGLQLKSNYYSHVQIWRDWWCGYHKPFHQFHESDLHNKIRSRDLFSLKMAKKVCEDWAALLLNEKTQIMLAHAVSSEFLQGKTMTEGVFGRCHFWQRANELVEKAFYSGTGAIVLRLDGIQEGDNSTITGDEKTRIHLEYLSAQNIIPITIQQGHIVEAAFCSDVLQQGETYIYLEVHMLEPSGYTITNRYFRATDGVLSPVPLPTGVVGRWETKSDIPLFSILRPNLVNCIDDNCGLGMSVFAQAIDCLKGVDLAFNNFCRDFQLGGKKVFINQDLVQKNGEGMAITPDDLCQQLFMTIGDKSPDDDQLIYEHNPALRVADNVSGIQAQLDYLSFKCGLGSKRYRFDNGSILTATQYVGDRQDLIQNVSKHCIAVEQMVIGVVRAILWAGKEVFNIPVDPDTEISIQFDDSVIVDKETERMRDKEDVRDGIMQKWEFRMKWYGEDEATAKKMVEPDDLEAGLGLED